jgi:lipoprotein signal peptidase
MALFQKLDDEMHFWAGMLISFVVFFVANFWFNQSVSSIVSYGFIIIGAICKELYDKYIKKTRFDWRDLKWTLIGGFILPFLFIVFDIIYYYSKP